MKIIEIRGRGRNEKQNVRKNFSKNAAQQIQIKQLYFTRIERMFCTSFAEGDRRAINEKRKEVNSTKKYAFPSMQN